MARLPTNTNTNPRTCPICQHPERPEIERLVLSIGPSNPGLTLAAIADAYDLSITDLKVHTLMHTPLALDFSQESEDALIDNFKSKAEIQPSDPTSNQSASSDSKTGGGAVTFRNRLVDKVDLREGDMLLASANEMLTTLTTLGRRIKAFASDGSDGSDQRLAAFCTTALVNLYVGTSSELRKNIQAIGDLNTQINGDDSHGNDGLTALAQALAGSISNSKQTEMEEEE